MAIIKKLELNYETKIRSQHRIVAVKYDGRKGTQVALLKFLRAEKMLGAVDVEAAISQDPVRKEFYLLRINDHPFATTERLRVDKPATLLVDLDAKTVIPLCETTQEQYHFSPDKQIDFASQIDMRRLSNAIEMVVASADALQSNTESVRQHLMEAVQKLSPYSTAIDQALAHVETGTCPNCAGTGTSLEGAALDPMPCPICGGSGQR